MAIALEVQVLDRLVLPETSKSSNLLISKQCLLIRRGRFKEPSYDRVCPNPRYLCWGTPLGNKGTDSPGQHLPTPGNIGQNSFRMCGFFSGFSEATLMGIHFLFSETTYEMNILYLLVCFRTIFER